MYLPPEFCVGRQEHVGLSKSKRGSDNLLVARVRYPRGVWCWVSLAAIIPSPGCTVASAFHSQPDCLPQESFLSVLLCVFACFQLQRTPTLEAIRKPRQVPSRTQFRCRNDSHPRCRCNSSCITSASTQVLSDSTTRSARASRDCLRNNSYWPCPWYHSGGFNLLFKVRVSYP